MPGLPEIVYDHYYRWQEMLDFLSAAAQQHPDLVSLHELTRTPEDRPLMMARITAPCDEPDLKPGYLVQANVHAPEVAGTTASLHLIRALLEGYAESTAIAGLLQQIVFYIVPRMNPDGAEFILSTGGAIRSRNTPRYRKNGLYQADVDGDGLILHMRREDPRGNLKPHPEDERMLIAREATDTQGPFYFLYNEGLVHDYDGGAIVSAERYADFNRNWAANWKPEHEQGGAGDFPFSQPEMQAFARFVYDHPNLFGIFGFHCGNNSVLRPPSTGSDDDIAPADLEKMKEIGARGEELTGFTQRAVVDYRLTSSKPIALQGHFHDWGYRHLGLFVYEVELGNIYNSLGITTEKYFDSTVQERRDYDLLALKWHDANPGQGGFTPWRPFDHPQLGPVEIGGWRRHFAANPLSTDMDRIAAGCTAFVLDHAGRRPWIQIIQASAEHIDGNVYRVRATVMNTGYLDTQITTIGHRTAQQQPVQVSLQGATVVSAAGPVQEIGHLAGTCGYKDLEWFVTADAGAPVTISAVSQKAGRDQSTVTLG